MAIEWKEEYSTGVNKIDEQHRKLFTFLNDLEELITQGIDSKLKVDKLLTSLGTDTQKHFSFEENCMKQYNCPVAQENKEAHNQFLNLFGNFQNERKVKGTSTSLLKSFHKTAESWVVSHICNIDVHLKSCVGRNRA
ncbi:MAG: hemerythrin family protein [Bacteroidetes bacterium]|nr:hemerythrin family protein [Bacteroidota bacterium]